MKKDAKSKKKRIQAAEFFEFPPDVVLHLSLIHIYGKNSQRHKKHDDDPHNKTVARLHHAVLPRPFPAFR